MHRSDFRNRRNYVAALASEAAAPVLRVLARSLARGRASAPKAWRTGIILGNGHIGDVLYRTCSLEHLASALPQCSWSYLTTPTAATVLRNNPSLAEILPLCHSAGASSVSAADREALRDRRFDVAISTENTRGYEGLILATRIGIPNRVGFTQKGFSGLTTLGIDLPQSVSRTSQIRRMVEAITQSTDKSELRPHVFPSATDRADADTEWQRLGIKSGEPVIACAITTRQATGCFPPEFFRDILQRAIARHPQTRVLYIGSDADVPLLTTEARHIGPAAAISAGNLNVRAMVPLLERCSAFLGSDSGPRHIANAARIPVFYVRNMGGSAAESGTYCPTEHDIAPDGEYLSPSQMKRALADIDRDSVAHNLVTAVAQRGLGSDVNTRR